MERVIYGCRFAAFRIKMSKNERFYENLATDKTKTV